MANNSKKNDKTYLERYRGIEKKYNLSVPVYKTLQFLRDLENELEQLNEKEEINLEIGDQCSDLYDYFNLIFDETHDLWEQMEKEWPDGMLLVGITEWFNDTIDEILADEDRRTDALTEYIYNIRTDKEVHVLLGDGETEEYGLPGVVSYEDQEDCKSFIRSLVERLMQEDGVLVLTYKPEGERCHVFSGFYFDCGIIEKITPKDLRNALSYNTNLPKNIIYTKADIDLS